jgi:hypothetical protein
VSKFGDILKNAKRTPATDDPPAEKAPTLDIAPAAATAPPSPAPRKGRPPGKRSDPAYEQVTAYIRGDLYRDVRIRLLQEGKGQEFSELVAELLAAWLAGRKPG